MAFIALEHFTRIAEALGPEALGPEALGPEALGPEVLHPEALRPKALIPESSHLSIDFRFVNHVSSVYKLAFI